MAPANHAYSYSVPSILLVANTPDGVEQNLTPILPNYELSKKWFISSCSLDWDRYGSKFCRTHPQLITLAVVMYVVLYSLNPSGEACWALGQNFLALHQLIGGHQRCWRHSGQNWGKLLGNLLLGKLPNSWWCHWLSTQTNGPAKVLHMMSHPVVPPVGQSRGF